MVLPSPWNTPRPRSPTSSPTSLRTTAFGARDATILTPVSPVSQRHSVKVIEGYKEEDGERPKSLSAAILLSGAGDESGGDEDEDFAGNESRFSTYTRNNLAQLDESLLLWMEKFSTSPSTSSESLPLTPTASSFASSSSTAETPLTPPNSPDQKRRPSIRAINLSPTLSPAGLFQEQFTPVSASFSADSTSAARPNRWWKALASSSTSSTLRKSTTSTPKPNSSEEMPLNPPRISTGSDWSLVSSASSMPDSFNPGWRDHFEGEVISRPYATFHPHPNVRPRSKSVKEIILRKKKKSGQAKGKQKADSASI
ncbi:hypothetical protein T439DRAFT_378030 [Meredithblackwellia eburnea MCA 4105]